MAVALAALEGGARLLGLKKGFFLLMTARDCMQRSATLGFELQPDCHVVWREKIDCTVNSIGLRSPELRDDDSVRLLTLGDSCTWGWGVKQNDAYPYVLQQELGATYGPNRYQVINGGRPAWSSYQGLVWLRERGLALEPVILILSFGFNDASKGGDDEEQIRSQARWYRLLLLDDFFLDRSLFYSWFRGRTQDPAGAAHLPVRVSAEKYDRNMREMVRLAREHGTKVLLLVFPHTKGTDKAHREAVAAIGRDLDVPILTYDGPRLDSLHPTARGYRTLVKELVARLTEDGFLPAR